MVLKSQGGRSLHESFDKMVEAHETRHTERMVVVENRMHELEAELLSLAALKRKLTAVKNV